MKLCTDCNIIKPIIDFHRNKTMKGGVTHYCKKCNTRRVYEWRKVNPEKRALQTKRYWALHSQERRSYCEKNSIERNRKKAIYRRENKSKIREWKINNKGMVNASARLQYAKRIKRVPQWASLKEIRDFYISCPSGMVVDHIIPLVGKTVSGLHVLSNLQYLTPEENCRKSNKFPY
jgi:hypothetical protein